MKNILIAIALLLSGNVQAQDAKVAEPTKEKKVAAEAAAKDTKFPMVEMKTNMGTIVIKLNAEKAPITVKNFLSYVDDKFYDGLIFHRVIVDFMIQGGGMKPDMSEKATKAPIKNEADNGLKNLKGTLAMARTGVVDSATAQFFINVKDNAFLDHRSKDTQGYGYAVFGEVASGMDVVEKIKNVKTGSKGMHDDVPATPVIIESMRRKN